MRKILFLALGIFSLSVSAVPAQELPGPIYRWATRTFAEDSVTE